MKAIMKKSKALGFSLIEILVVMVILSVVSGAIFSHIGTAQQRARTEQVKLDNFQEARDFVDQFFRDISQVGFPNSRMIDTTSGSWAPALANPLINDSRLAVGLTKIDANELWFEGDVDGDGLVDSVVYKINGSGTCSLCLQRSQVAKVTGSSLTGQTQSWGTEVNDVVTTTIFTYFKADGTQVTGLPIDISISNNAQIIASIKTIKISLQLRNNAVIDPKTGQPIETNFEGEVSLNNCNMAASGQTMSC